MLLREYLETYTKDQLLEQARNLELKKCSKLRKAELIERIVEWFCAENVLRNRLTCLTKEQLTLFRRACEMPQEVSVHETIDAMLLNHFWMGSFEEPTDRFCVFEELAENFKKVEDEDFLEEQSQKGWLVKCVRFFINYYGVAPLEIVYELYKLKGKGSIDEMIDMLWEMPVDMIESCIFTMDKLGMQDLPKGHPIYSSKGLLIHIPVLEDEEFGDSLSQQKNKHFYLPSVQQIEEITGFGYEASASSYKKLKTFLMKQMHMSYDQAVTWCVQAWEGGYIGDSPTIVMNQMREAGVVFDNDQQMNEFVMLLVDAHNHTRRKENRGHSAVELGNRGTSFAMTSMGPKKAPVVREEKKIYANDPCPCGSGKKYKKCCGKAAT